ncbi:calcium-binding protein [Microvirga sp. 17 mud 1-3]|uniref:calcium-binding protein n=1 Tax=Microvirga sp. 17 mud 1-3 TaxID=2082949 RepID=UPI0013A5A362|nr:calcium-binding protein [Microvirga sp. 17 mud 1-3]
MLDNPWDADPPDFIPGNYTTYTFIQKSATSGILVETAFGTTGNDAMSGSGILFAKEGNDGLTGRASDDALYGGAGNDWLDGGAGSDILDGGDGWDVVSYLSATSGITVDLTTNQNSGAALGDVVVDVEVLQCTNFNDMLTGVDRGGGTGVQLYGEGGDDGLIGKGGGDALYGGDGNDWLDGGPGGDILDGGAGWDVLSYQSAASGVTVNLTTNANGGAAAGDQITNVEVVQGTNSNDMLTGVDRGNGNGVQLYGEGGDDGLTGKAGGDALYGGAGNDWLDGGPGSDILDGGEGWDVVSYLSANGSVTVDLTTNQNGGAAAGDRISNIEVLQGTNANDYLTGVDRGGGSGVQLYGEGGNDNLTGKGGGDYLFGGSGNDWLDGGGGSDILNGGAGQDSFAMLTALGAGNVDRIEDFSAAEGDRIVLSRGAFANMASGSLSSGAFKLGTVATTAEQHILYNQSTGELFYDVDGSGAQAAIKFAVLTAGTALEASNIFVL